MSFVDIELIICIEFNTVYVLQSLGIKIRNLLWLAHTLCGYMRINCLTYLHQMFNIYRVCTNTYNIWRWYCLQHANA